MKETNSIGQLNLALGVMRQARMAHGWTQLDLARRVECSETKISKIETGRSNPSGDLKAKIARALGIEAWAVGQ